MLTVAPLEFRPTPRYNRTGWLGVKYQLTYLLTHPPTHTSIHLLAHSSSVKSVAATLARCTCRWICWHSIVGRKNKTPVQCGVYLCRSCLPGLAREADTWHPARCGGEGRGAYRDTYLFLSRIAMMQHKLQSDHFSLNVVSVMFIKWERRVAGSSHTQCHSNTTFFFKDHF